MDLVLKGLRALVTGASKGIGAATAEALAEEGCHLRLAARNGEAMQGLADRLSSAHEVQCSVHPVDLRNQSDLKRLATEAADIDILVNCAGDIPRGSLEQIDEATWRHAWELKVFGYINLTRLVYPQLKARGGGVILNVVGTGGEAVRFDYIAGSAGNAALMAFTRAMGGASMADGVRVLGVNPGFVATERMTDMRKTDAVRRFGDESRWRELEAEILSGLPEQRAATAREIGDMLTFLASRRSGYTSGVIVTIDGGSVARQGMRLNPSDHWGGM